jgi:LPS-assembly lipoprotein
LIALSAGCGFHLRGQAQLPFESLYVDAGGPSQFASQVARAISGGSKTRIATSRDDAQATLQILTEARERAILSLSAGGRVREITLRYRVAFRVYDKEREYLPASEIVLRRDLTYNDSDVIAKEQEESLLYRDMQSDAVHQLVRRLESVRIGA